MESPSILIEKAKEKAKEILLKNSCKYGLLASGQYYRDIWGRDALISCLGLIASKDERLMEIAKRSIDTLAKFQRETGQLPNKVSPDLKKVGYGEGGCIDASLWYPIAVLNFTLATGDYEFLEKHKKRIKKAVEFAKAQDVNGDFLLEIYDGSNWNDVLIRSGRVLTTNALFYASLSASEKILEEKDYWKIKLKENFNLLLWPKKENLERVRKEFGYSYIVKDFEFALRDGEKPYFFAEVGFRKYDSRFDVFGNVLAILFKVYDEEEKREKIMEEVERRRLDQPYPIKCLDPPIFENDFFRPFYFRQNDLPFLEEPGNYHNGGIWPFIGGFYILTLPKEKAKEKLERLIEACKLNNWSFPEWISAKDFKPYGSKFQSWSAAMLLASIEYCYGDFKIVF